MKTTVLLAGALLAAAAPFARAGSPEAYIADYAKAHDFSGSILVEQHGTVRYTGSFGRASRVFDVPNTRTTRYRIASVTKLFTAVLILQLAELGKLDIEQPVGRYLSDYTGEAAQKVTLHQLLDHTSGLPNFDRVADAATALREGLPTYQTPYTSDQLITKFCSGALVHVPGTVFDYNNGDYLLLGKVVERVTGLTYEQALQQRIFDPLQMRSSGFLHQSDIVPRLADAYFRRDDLGRWSPDLPVYPENWYAAGALYSSVDDLRAFADALFGRTLIGQHALDQLTRPGLDDYGFGVWSYETTLGGSKRRVMKRPGRIMGAQAQFFHVFDPDTTIVLLANTDAADLDAFVAGIAKHTVD